MLTITEHGCTLSGYILEGFRSGETTNNMDKTTCYISPYALTGMFRVALLIHLLGFGLQLTEREGLPP
jgi:hypothetical protein